MTIKVFGEARSATTYLEELLRLNGVEVLPNGAGHPSGWKHGFPIYTEGALHVFLMRDVYEWTRSMLTGFDARFRGLKEPFGGSEDHWGEWDNLIECRTTKYSHYISFVSNSNPFRKSDGILLKTEYLKQHPEVITEFTDVTDVQDIKKHVRLGIDAKDDPARPELTKEQITWIDSQTNHQLESFVDNLTYADYRRAYV